MWLKRGLLILCILLFPYIVSSQGGGFPGGLLIPDLGLGEFSMVAPALTLVAETGSGWNDDCDSDSGAAGFVPSLGLSYGPNLVCDGGEELPDSLPSGDKCLLFAIEEDVSADDCAYAKVGEFSILTGVGRTISDFDGYSSCYDSDLDGCESDATCLFSSNYEWTGAYVCYGSLWYICMPDIDGTQAIKDGDNFFVCDETAGNWIDKSGEDYCSQMGGACGDSCPDGFFEYSDGNFECSVLGLGSTCCASPQNKNVCEENGFLWHPDEGDTSSGNACCGDSEDDFGNFFNDLVCIEQVDGSLAWIDQNDACIFFDGEWESSMLIAGEENSVGPLDGCCGDDTDAYDGTEDFGFFDSTSNYFCLNDYLDEEIVEDNEWHWWDAAGAGNSYKIHTITIN